jgi:hypothetical protein
MPSIHFGVTLPQIKRSWEETRAAALEFDRLGFHSVWFNDHLYGIPGPQLPILEAWTALAAIGAITTRVELGTLVSADSPHKRPIRKRHTIRRPRTLGRNPYYGADKGPGSKSDLSPFLRQGACQAAGPHSRRPSQ